MHPYAGQKNVKSKGLDKQKKFVAKPNKKAAKELKKGIRPSTLSRTIKIK